VQVRFGRTVPKGFLPVFSVDTEEEAEQLIVLCCPRDDQGNYYARELAAEQTLENLRLFGDKLARGYQMLKEAAKRRRE
jgi:hypothetical protein